MLFSAAATQSPIQFGPYLLTECVGQGGMAVVYKATRRGPNGFEKTVVVKAMLPTLSAQREFVAMFSAEARLMAALSHPNIVQVHDFGVVDGIPYLAMEYLPGRNLSQLRAALAALNLKMPVGAALAIAREMCHGLGYAHEFVDADGRRRHIIHRDVSPSNVMVCRDGSVKLLDFGVAKIVGEFDYDATQSFKGKYAYMAPEQVNRQAIDRRADIFSAGIVIHELLTSRRLFAAPTELETLQRVAAAQVVAPSVDNPEVPRALDAIVKKALARDPRDRHASGGELAEALETLDALAWPRKRLAAYVAELFAGDWMVVCEVCGKSVLPGIECTECGTEAPDAAEPPPQIANDAKALSARQALVPLLGPMPTDRNEVAPPPVAADEPQPLPPPPPFDARHRAARARLSVVRTPLPPPLQPPPTELAVGPEPPTQKTVMPSFDDNDDGDGEDDTRVESVGIESAPTPPRLFVVPRPKSVETPAFAAPNPPPPPLMVPLPPPPGVAAPLPVTTSASLADSGVRMPLSPLATPRPSAPQPLFVVPPTPPPMGATPNLRGDSKAVWYAMAAAAVAIVVLAATLVARGSDVAAVAPVVQPSPAPSPSPSPIAAPIAAPIAPAIPPTATVVKKPAAVVKPAALVKAPARHRVARARPVAAAPAAEEPERTVKEGRIVDPFAGLK